ncbi:type 2 isopentenyl-diphosphate Delta-isomerase [Hutsoniella sourekii]|uniref:type 2 isopentenyl-diphosphate Delta-isomerase n=1 Tax=Hutsoniella sourekii TaxID=87650 RepID=UPI000484241E|nr:type 2 isopentenyl-diphosphate Delta-isomerase [Hutsoniella sourekii]
MKPEQSINQQRKDDHVNHALEQQKQLQHSAFDDLRIIHHSFNQVDFEAIDLTTHWAGNNHSLPFYINGMTGGSAFTKKFNHDLAEVAKQTGLSMASGSVSIALKEPQVSDSFTVIREQNPDGFVLANLGAHHDLDNARRAVELLQADALQIHLNIPQEVVMPEGDRDFSTWSTNIQSIVEGLGLPVIVKEVGFGMSQQTIQHLIDLGVETVDVSGRGGTNFVSIENNRRQNFSLESLASWGQTTPESLLEARPFLEEIEVLASGGIRHYLDIVKALVMGAKACGISGFFLQSIQDQGIDGTVRLVEEMKEAIQLTCLMAGAQSVKHLKDIDWIITGDLAQYAQARKLTLK